MIQLSLTPFPVLHTQRLTLRCVEREDEGALLTLRSDPEVNQFLSRPKTTSADEVRSFIGKLLDGIRANANAYWVLVLDQSQQPIGIVCLLNFDLAEQRAELGFELLPEFQGQGLMREAVAEILNFAFTNGFRTIEGWVHRENAGSLKLLRTLGFARDLQAEANHRGDSELERMFIYSLRAPQPV